MDEHYTITLDDGRVVGGIRRCTRCGQYETPLLEGCSKRRVPLAERSALPDHSWQQIYFDDDAPEQEEMSSDLSNVPGWARRALRF